MKVVVAGEPLPELAQFLASYAHCLVRSEARKMEVNSEVLVESGAG